MLDTNIFNRLLDGHFDLSDLGAGSGLLPGSNVQNRRRPKMFNDGPYFWTNSWPSRPS
jgi:hypothetical protein